VPIGLALLGIVASGCASAARSGPAPFPGSAPNPAHAALPNAAPERAPVERADAVVQSALSLRGTPYRFGGSTPAQGLDCSGLVAYVMAEHAIQMPRSVAEQFGVGAPVTWEQLRRGDLVFFSTIGAGATHVGIVTDTDRVEFVHAPADGASVRVERFDAPYWRTRFVGARRVFQAPTQRRP
jgi:cell wall-associated NlpC family hydrolase